MQLDDVDAAILRALQEDARRSFRDIAALVGASTPTVSARVKRMEELGIIQGYRAVLSRRLLGNARYVLRVRARPADLAAVAERLGAIPGVEDVLHLSGGLLQAHVAVGPQDDVGRVLGHLMEMPEVLEYEERRVLDGHARPAIPLAAAGGRVEVDVRCHACKGPIHGAGVRKRFGDREHAFCCRLCLRDFDARWARMQAGAAGP